MPNTEGVLGEVAAIEAVREKRTKPSFMASVMEGAPDFSSVYPYPLQEADDRAIGDKFLLRLERFLLREVDPDVIDREAHIPFEVLDGLAKLGCLGMVIPEKYGGLGLSKTNYNRALMLIGSRSDVVALTLSAHQSIGLPHPLLHFATEEQRAKFLPLLAKDHISAFALTEKNAGSDPSLMETRAEPTPDGNFYVINGEKWYCTNGMIADVILLMAKVPPYGPKDIGAFIVPMDGVRRERCEFMGFRGLENGRLNFYNVKVPKENMIGPPNKGLRLALTALNDGRVSVSALCLAFAKRAWEPTIWWANTRKQFGQTLGEHEANRVKIAQMETAIFAMEAVTWLVSALAEEGKTDLRIEAAASKLFCSERLWHDVINPAMEIRGGRGYEKVDSLRQASEPAIPTERWMRDAYIYLIGEGASNTLHLSLVRDLLEPYIDSFADFEKAEGFAKAKKWLGLAGFTAIEFLGTFSAGDYPDLFPMHYILREHIRYVHGASMRLARKKIWLIARLGRRLKERQMLTFRLVDIALDLFMMSVVCAYADRLSKECANDKNKKGTAIKIADLFCREAKLRVRENFRKLGKNNDVAADELAESALTEVPHWLSEGVVDQGY